MRWLEWSADRHQEATKCVARARARARKRASERFDDMWRFRILRLVRLPLLKREFLVECVAPHPLIRSRLSCRHLLDEARQLQLEPTRRARLAAKLKVWRGDWRDDSYRAFRARRVVATRFWASFTRLAAPRAMRRRASKCSIRSSANGSSDARWARRARESASPCSAIASST